MKQNNQSLNFRLWLPPIILNILLSYGAYYIWGTPGKENIITKTVNLPVFIILSFLIIYIVGYCFNHNTKLNQSKLSDFSTYAFFIILVSPITVAILTKGLIDMRAPINPEAARTSSLLQSVLSAPLAVIYLSTFIQHNSTPKAILYGTNIFSIFTLLLCFEYYENNMEPNKILELPMLALHLLYLYVISITTILITDYLHSTANPAKAITFSLIMALLITTFIFLLRNSYIESNFGEIIISILYLVILPIVVGLISSTLSIVIASKNLPIDSTYQVK